MREGHQPTSDIKRNNEKDLEKQPRKQGARSVHQIGHNLKYFLYIIINVVVVLTRKQGCLFDCCCYKHLVRYLHLRNVLCRNCLTLFFPWSWLVIFSTTSAVIENWQLFYNCLVCTGINIVIRWDSCQAEMIQYKGYSDLIA